MDPDPSNGSAATGPQMPPVLPPASMGTAPPILDTPQPIPSKPSWRWGILVLLFALYPVVIGLISGLGHDSGGEAVLSGSASDLVRITVRELGLFAVVFVLGWLVCRPTLDDLMLRWRGGIRPVLLAVAYSIGLRIGLGLIVAGVLMVLHLLGGNVQSSAEQMRPQVEALVDKSALTQDPAYFIAMLTLVSFGLGGLREELWRVTLIAGLANVMPRQFSGTRGMITGAVIAALVFGIGHLTQGWGAVGLTALLGLGLGIIMVLHRSIWEAALAHGFFNATSFVFLYVILKHFPGKIPGL